LICVENAIAQRRTSNRTANPMLASGCGREPFDAASLGLFIGRVMAGRGERPIGMHGPASPVGLGDALRKLVRGASDTKQIAGRTRTGQKTSSSRSRSGCGTTFLSQLGVNRGLYNFRSKRSRRNWLNSSSCRNVRTFMTWADSDEVLPAN